MIDMSDISATDINTAFNAAQAALKRVFGYDSFRAGQYEAVRALLGGEDLLAIMPTGGGKSICYQLPALVEPGLTVVISPLISLMKDQVVKLTQLDVSAAAINSSIEADAAREIMDRARAGELKLLYLAPERLEYEGARESLWACDVRRVIVDEAHCVSQWGHDFRPCYLLIADFVDGFRRRPCVGAFTATATQRVQDDISQLLRLRAPREVHTGFDRANLAFSVVRLPKRRRIDWIKAYVAAHRGQSGIVYCSSRHDAETTAAELNALCYHAGMDAGARNRAQEAFINDEKDIICATNAFGMGIDKPDVRFVIHYHMPASVEAYWQEAGRAGRDGLDAECILLCDGSDAMFWKQMIAREEGEPDEKQKRVERLNAMARYMYAPGCLRKYLVGYFGETISDCGVCANCVGGETRDVTVSAQKILSAVKRLGERVGKSTVAAVLNGSKEKRILERGYDSIKTYGAMAEVSRDEITALIDELISQGYLQQTQGEYPVLKLTPASVEVLLNGQTVSMRMAAIDFPEPKTPKKTKSKAEAGDAQLCTALRELRKRIADKAGVPPFVIFGDKTLIDLSAKRPRTLDAFAQVFGVGEYKLKKYGPIFLNAINEYIAADGEAPSFAAAADSGGAPSARQTSAERAQTIPETRDTAAQSAAPPRQKAAQYAERTASLPGDAQGLPPARATKPAAQLTAGGKSVAHMLSDLSLFMSVHSDDFLRDFAEYTPDDLQQLLKLLRDSLN